MSKNHAQRLYEMSAYDLLNQLKPGLQHTIMDALEEKGFPPFDIEPLTATIVPAQPGWFVATAFEYQKTLDKDAIIAWVIRPNEEIRPEPITANPVRNDVCTAVPGYVLCDPYGNYVDARAPNKHKAMKSEEEAVRYCLDEMEGTKPGIVHEKTSEGGGSVEKVPQS